MFAWPQPRLWPHSCVIVSPVATARIAQTLIALKNDLSLVSSSALPHPAVPESRPVSIRTETTSAPHASAAVVITAHSPVPYLP